MGARIISGHLNRAAAVAGLWPRLLSSGPLKIRFRSKTLESVKEAWNHWRVDLDGT